MTRDDFKFKKIDIETHFYNKGIDAAFNYFESRTCESCSIPNRNGYCRIIGTNTMEDFVCNKWSGKDD